MFYTLSKSQFRLGAIAACLLLALPACSDKPSPTQPSSSHQPAASSKPSAVVVPDACKLLTVDEIQAATGWNNATPHNTTVDPSYLSTCNFTDGGDASKMIAVNVAVGGATHASSAQFAKSVGDNGGMLAHPATAVEGYPVPVIEMDMGATHGMQARTPQAVELTVITASADATLALFPRALGRLDAPAGAH